VWNPDHAHHHSVHHDNAPRRDDHDYVGSSHDHHDDHAARHDDHDHGGAHRYC
jgi:hypothetical protein